mgnify:CR=1 FL=1
MEFVSIFGHVLEEDLRDVARIYKEDEEEEE